MSPGRGRRKRMDFLRISRIDQDTRIEAIIRAQDSIREGDHASMSGTSAEHFGIGRPVSHFEDPRLLRGEGRYINDLVLPGMAHLAFVRSPHPHARIVSIDAAEARAAPGVLGVFTVEDLERDGVGTTAPSLRRSPPDGTPMFWRAHPGLAREKVRHVGDPVAIVVAETLPQAQG